MAAAATPSEKEIVRALMPLLRVEFGLVDEWIANQRMDWWMDYRTVWGLVDGLRDSLWIGGWIFRNIGGLGLRFGLLKNMDCNNNPIQRNPGREATTSAHSITRIIVVADFIMLDAPAPSSANFGWWSLTRLTFGAYLINRKQIATVLLKPAWRRSHFGGLHVGSGRSSKSAYIAKLVLASAQDEPSSFSFECCSNCYHILSC